MVAAYGRRGLLAKEDGTKQAFLVRGRQLKVYCGDWVFSTEMGTGEPLLVTGVAPRDNQLERLTGRGDGRESIASNFTHLLVVMAALPAPDLYLTDRYLCAAQLMGVKSALIWNKADLVSVSLPQFAGYTALGYPLWNVSAGLGTGLGAIRAWIGQGTAILVGQSGVGKSSLLNGLIPNAGVATGEMSYARDEGRHTTTASVLHTLPEGGRLVDTPGVRDFVPAVPERATISRGFIEIEAAGRECRFLDCLHLRESHCAVREALSEGRIDPRRFESYRRLLNLQRQALR